MTGTGDHSGLKGRVGTRVGRHCGVRFHSQSVSQPVFQREGKSRALGNDEEYEYDGFMKCLCNLKKQ